MDSAFSSVAGCAWGQDKHPRIEVQNYTIDADINPRTQSIVATAKVNFTPLEDANEAVFELNNALTVSKAVDGSGQPLQTSRNPQDFTVKVSFPGGLHKNQASEISFTYDGKLTGNEDSPVSGIKFAALHPDFGYLLYPARWFPVNGYTVNRFTADLRITTPSDYRVIGSGDLKTDRASNGRTIYSFHYDKPSFPGEHCHCEGRSSASLLAGNHARKSFSGISKLRMPRLTAMKPGKIMTFLTSEYGLAPQANLTFVETEAGAVNGYSAPGIIFLAPNSITHQVNTRVLANQLSRQWWGVLVSPTTRNHLWLINGPARYSEILYAEHTAGPGAMEADLKATYVEALTVKDPPVLQAARLEDYSPEYWALTVRQGSRDSEHAAGRCG